jgi:chromosomal replication initiation ATPase DnaA
MHQMEIALNNGAGRRIPIRRRRRAVRVDPVVVMLDELTARRLREATVAYRAVSEKNPDNRYRLAMAIGAEQFGLKERDLRTKSRKTHIAEVRQLLMAWVRMVTLRRGSRANSLKRLGRCFKRHHATVLYALAKYGAAVEKELNKGGCNALD